MAGGFIPYGQTSANIANAIADVQEQNRLATIQNQQAADEHNRALQELTANALKMRLDKQAATRTSLLDAQAEQQRQFQNDMAVKEFGIRKATLEQGGWQAKELVDPESGKAGIQYSKPGEPSKFEPYPFGYLPEGLVAAETRVGAAKVGEIKSFARPGDKTGQMYDWELTPMSRIRKIDPETMLPDPATGDVWVRLGVSKASPEDIFDRWVREQQYTSEHPKVATLEGQALREYDKWRMQQDQVEKAQVDPSLGAVFARVAGARDVTEWLSKVKQQRAYVQLLYRRLEGQYDDLGLENGLPMPPDLVDTQGAGKTKPGPNVERIQ